MRPSVLFLLPFFAATASAEPIAKISADDFAALPSLRSPSLSPDGTQIVATSVDEGKHNIVLIDAAQPASKPRVISVGDMKLSAIHWAGDKRLILEILATGQIFGLKIPIGQLAVVDLDTGAARIADKHSRGIYGGDVLFVDKSGSWALVASQDDIYSTPSVKRVDLATGNATVVEKPKPDVWNWYVDENGVVRGGVAYDDKRWKLWYRSKAGEPFQVAKGKFEKDDDSAVDRFIFSTDGDEGFVVTNEKTGRFGVYRYNFAKAEVGETIFESPIADISTVITEPGTDHVIGVRYHDDRWHTFWMDQKFKTLQARIDKALPNLDNQILGDPSSDKRMLVYSGSASNPGLYFLYDGQKSTMAPVVETYASIDASRLADVQAVHYKARDGLDIPAYLTLPKGRSPAKLPLILMPHGGPFARDEWTYDPMVQFLANRGYAVLQPQFRGSTGYGKDYASKGYGEWGRKMQDDLDDGVDWLVKSGQVDAKRVCIVGGSYGGYAALWGAIRNPERYRCAVSISGVTDPASQLKENRKSFAATRYFRAWQKKIQGEESFDLNAVSPLKQQALLKIPVLIAHGEEDETVLSKQSHQMVKALEGRKADVQSVFYKEGGHGFSSSKDFADFLKRLDAFLAKHNPS